MIFQKFCQDIKNLIVLGGTKGFNLKSHEMIAHLLHSYSSDKQSYGVVPLRHWHGPNRVKKEKLLEIGFIAKEKKKHD